jgi:hypothetical protein
MVNIAIEKTALSSSLRGWGEDEDALEATGRCYGAIVRAIYSAKISPKDSGLGGAAVPREAATPDRAGRMARRGTDCRAKPRDFENVRSSNRSRNKTRSLSLMSALRVNSGTTTTDSREVIAASVSLPSMAPALALRKLAREYARVAGGCSAGPSVHGSQ